MSIIRYELNKFLEQERERIFLWVPVVFAAGILFYFSLRIEPSIWWSLAVIETLIVLAYLWRTNLNRLSILGWLAIFVLGFTNIQLRAYHLHNIPLSDKEETVYLKGYVASSGYNYRGRPYLILEKMKDFDNQPIAGKYRITLLSADDKIRAGNCVETVAEMRPLLLPNMVNGYQFHRQQYFEGIKATGYSDVSVHKIDCADIEVTSGWFLPVVAKLRDKIVQKIYAVLPPQTAGVAAAVIAGEKGRVSLSQTKEYRDAGLAHFLAISGLHMGIIAGMAFFVIRTLAACISPIALRFDTKKIAAVLAIIMSFIYLIISGWQISTQRAFIMTTLVLIGVLCGRKAISMRMAAWAALVILIAEPQVLISAGFQMSFAAVIMLIAFYEKHTGIIGSFSGKHPLSRGIWIVGTYLAGIVLADLIASLATLPFVIYHFNRISVYTCLANLAAAPIICLWIMPGVLLSLLTMPFGWDKYPLILTGKGIEIVNQITHYVAGLDYASFQIVSMPDWGLLLIVSGGLWLAVWRSRWRYCGWLLIVVGLLSILTVKQPDVVTDNEAKTFAVRSEQGKMVILPNRGNYFTKQMWYEKLAQQPLSDEQTQLLYKIYRGETKDKQFLDLSCDEEKCIYKKRVVLHKEGGLLIDGKDYSQNGAMSVYHIDKHPLLMFVSDRLGNRYWNFFIK